MPIRHQTSKVNSKYIYFYSVMFIIRGLCKCCTTTKYKVCTKGLLIAHLFNFHVNGHITEVKPASVTWKYKLWCHCRCSIHWSLFWTLFQKEILKINVVLSWRPSINHFLWKRTLKSNINNFLKIGVQYF